MHQDKSYEDFEEMKPVGDNNIHKKYCQVWNVFRSEYLHPLPSMAPCSMFQANLSLGAPSYQTLKPYSHWHSQRQYVPIFHLQLWPILLLVDFVLLLTTFPILYGKKDQAEVQQQVGQLYQPHSPSCSFQSSAASPSRRSPPGSAFSYIASSCKIP